MLKSMVKKLEVGRLQGCEVRAGLRKMHWQSSLGDIKRAEPKSTCLGENFFLSVCRREVGEERDDVCLGGMRSPRLCSGLWHEPNICAQMADNGKKGTELLFCGPFGESLQRTGVG